MAELNLATHRVVFLDHGSFAEEGFKSGLFIIVRELLDRFREAGFAPAIWSLASGKTGFEDARDAGFPLVNETVKEAGQETASFIESTLKALSAKIVVTTVPSVFLDPRAIALFAGANASGARVISVLGDPLFPKTSGSANLQVQDLYRELARAEVVGVGDATRAAFTQFTGIPTKRLLNPFSPKTFVVTQSDRSPRYIGMVNVHPLKGTNIFDRIAVRMPEHEFLIVKNWPDVPPYTPPSANVTYAEFFENPKELYSKLKLLLVPSMWGEGPARVVTEALANRIPVIANRIGSLGEFESFGVSFIQPPLIEGYELVGTVLHPRTTATELDRVADEYVALIRELMRSPADWKRRTEEAGRHGRRYLALSGRALKSLISECIKV